MAVQRACAHVMMCASDDVCTRDDVCAQGQLMGLEDTAIAMVDLRRELDDTLLPWPALTHSLTHWLTDRQTDRLTD